MLARDWLERFHEKVDRSGGPDACWPWTGAYNKAQKRKGETEPRQRPVFRLGGGGRKGDTQIIVYAHRLALCLDDGTNYDDHAGQECCHHPVLCNNSKCCNPKHLRWCTPEQNRQDRYGEPDRVPLHPVLFEESHMTEQNGHGRDHVRDHENDETAETANGTHHRRPHTDAEREDMSNAIRKLIANAPDQEAATAPIRAIHEARQAARAGKGA